MEFGIECALFVLGLAFGSFLNVCISRIPRDQSIVSPPSHCPGCGARIRWRDNVPLLSWLLLKGRCRDCARPISPRYIAVELITAVLFTACYLEFGPAWAALKFMVFGFMVVGLIFMDAETGLLPREFTYTGIVLGLAFSWLAVTDSSGTQFLLRVMGWDPVLSDRQLSLLDAFLGGLVGAGFFYLAWAGYYLIRQRHGLGFGDIALMGMSGAFLGLKLTVLVIFTAPILGLLYALFLFGRHRREEAIGGTSKEAMRASAQAGYMQQELPFGVFLGTSSLLAVFAGETAWRWYMTMVSG